MRVAKKLTLEQVADRPGLGQQYISDLERAKRNPTVITLYKLAQAFGISHVELVLPDGKVKPER